MKFSRLRNDKRPEIKLNKLQLEMKNSVEQKVQQEVYKFEKIKCPICADVNSEQLGEKDRYGLYFSTNICTTCGLIFTSPRMDQLSYNKFYNSEYRKLYGGDEKPTELFFLDQRWRGKQIYNFLKENKILNKNSINVLEVGCGAGGILDFFREKGAEIIGIDLGLEYINYGKEKHDLDLRCGTLKDFKLEQNLDLIIYSHCLEHILDINKEIELIKKISNKNTIIYIEVPGVKNIHNNYNMNILRYFQNAHTFHFTLDTLCNLMKKEGFKLIAGNQKVESAFMQGTIDINNQNDYKNVIEYIEYIEKKRAYYFLTLSGILKNSKGLISKIANSTGTMETVRKVFSFIYKNH